MNRDFKGVWIPKEIWLSTKLTMLEKIIFTEINSLDNEDHCIASNDYLAEFCGCSKSSITKAIKHLQELKLIEVCSFNGRARQIRVVNFTTQPSKISDAESEKILPINIINNNFSPNISSNLELDKKDNKLQGFLGSAKKEKKLNLYDKCKALIDDFTIRNNCLNSRENLIKYLDMLIHNAKETGIPFYSNNFKGKLNQLEKLPKNDWDKIIKNSLDNGWVGLYELKGEMQLRPDTKETKEQREKFIENMEKQGKRVKF